MCSIKTPLQSTIKFKVHLSDQKIRINIEYRPTCGNERTSSLGASLEEKPDKLAYNEEVKKILALYITCVVHFMSSSI